MGGGAVLIWGGAEGDGGLPWGKSTGGGTDWGGFNGEPIEVYGVSRGRRAVIKKLIKAGN